MATNDPLLVVALAVGCYVLGSIPVAWLIARIHLGQDLRTLGSGNVGVMNTALSVHRWAGLLVLSAEIAKGAVAVVLARVAGGGDVAVGVAALAVFVGTRWPVWLRFHGGRGNTAGAASVALISPLGFAVLLGLWALARLLTHDNFVATRIMLALLGPVLALATGSAWWGAVGIAYALLFVTTHRRETDDHGLLKQRYPSAARFLLSRPRGRHHR